MNNFNGVLLIIITFILGQIAYFIQRFFNRSDKKNDEVSAKLDTINASVMGMGIKHEQVIEKINYTGRELEKTQIRVGEIEKELLKKSK